MDLLSMKLQLQVKEPKDSVWRGGHLRCARDIEVGEKRQNHFDPIFDHTQTQEDSRYAFIKPMGTRFWRINRQNNRGRFQYCNPKCL